MRGRITLIIITVVVFIVLSSCKIDDNSPLVDIDGNAYTSIAIDNEEWSAENLSVTRFRNGDSIYHAASVKDWIDADKKKTPAWCYYDNNELNGKKYGKLYNWHAVKDSRGLAPDGWRIATKKDWSSLVNFLGGQEKAGAKMKLNGENEFNGQLSGDRLYSGNFTGLTKHAYWWSSSESTEYHGYYAQIHGHKSDAFIHSDYKGFGKPVRFVKE